MNWRVPYAGRHEKLIGRLVDGILAGGGESDPALRQSVEARSETLTGVKNLEKTELPDIIRAYVDKIALHAYKVTEDDILSLKEAGFSEDVIFEISVSAALGTGLARLERGLEALKGGQ